MGKELNLADPKHLTNKLPIFDNVACANAKRFDSDRTNRKYVTDMLKTVAQLAANEALRVTSSSLGREVNVVRNDLWAQSSGLGLEPV